MSELGIRVQVGDRLRVTDPHLAFEDKVLIGTVEGVDRHNGFLLSVDDGFRVYYKAHRKGTITVERLEEGAS